jgi:KDO2-lipid IV(A) lauroyltransferase
MANLALAFPEKSYDERKFIAKRFYRNFTDNFIEIIKLLSISKKQLQKRFAGEAVNINEYYSTGRNVQIHLGHFFNWEYANLSLGLKMKYRLLVVYMPITMEAMDKIFYKMRSRFKSKLIAATSYLKEFRQYRRERFALVFVYDQSAGNTEQAYWLPFFGKLTPFVTGPEKSAHLNNTIVFYAKFEKIKRGHYYVKFVEVNSDVKKLPEGELTKQMIKHLEANVKEQPENYLWTHRRWKHTFDPSRHRTL